MALLQMVFGVTNSVLSIFLKFGIWLLFKVLKNEEHAQVKVPEVDDIATYKAAIQDNIPDLSGVWCIMDGLKIPIQKAADEETQNAYYNGWLHGHFVGFVYVFVLSGFIMACMLNAPRLWHDTVITKNGGLYEMLSLCFCSIGIYSGLHA
jgi:hypothetical protein